MINHMYMQAGNRRKKQNSDYIRTYAPYAATALLVLVLFWGVDSIKQDTHRKQYEPAEVVQPPTVYKAQKDWTHKLSTAKTYDDKGAPDDDTASSCPMPTGNWGHTCDREITIEGPCNGKCMLKARCQDVKEKFKETTFEYNEGRYLEIKNVNGLLCSIEDGSPSCGVNFHGNLALKNCQGYIPRRHEVIHDGLYAPPPTEDKKSEPEKDKYNMEKDTYMDDDDNKDPDDDDSSRRRRGKAYDDDDYNARGKKRWNDDDDRGNKRGGGMEEPVRERAPAKRSYDEFEEYHPLPKKAPPMPRNDYDEPERRTYRRTDADDTTARRGRRYQDTDFDEEPDDDRMLRGVRRRNRYDDDEGPQRRLRGLEAVKNDE